MHPRHVQNCLRCESNSSIDSRAPVEASQEDEEADPARDDDSSVFRAQSESGSPFTALRWATRCFAVECVCRIVTQCESTDPAHFDMALAQERRLHESTGRTTKLSSFILLVETQQTVTSPSFSPPQTSWSSILVTWSAWHSWQRWTTATSCDWLVCRPYW